MRTIKFRGIHDCKWTFVYGDLVQDGRNLLIQTYDTWDGGATQVKPDSVGQFTDCYDGGGNEIYEGDYLEIDFEGAAKIIGDGSLISDLKASKPTPEAQLHVEYRQARFELVWRTKNGGVDTGVGLYLIEPIKKFVKVKGSATNGNGQCELRFA